MVRNSSVIPGHTRGEGEESDKNNGKYKVMHCDPEYISRGLPN